jgi:hypothetical protein
MKKPIDTNAKSDIGSKSEKKKVCKNFADLSALMDWVVDGHQSCEIYKTNGLKDQEDKKEIGDERD